MTRLRPLPSLAALFLLSLLAIAGPATAQTTAPAVPSAAPSATVVPTAEAPPAPAAEPPVVASGGTETAHFLAARLARMREHFRSSAEALPALPQSFAAAGAAFGKAAGEAGPWRIALGAVLSLLAGGLAEWLFGRAAAGLRARRDGIAIRALPDRLTKVAIDAVVAFGGVLAFTLGTLVAVLAQGWPGAIHQAAIVLVVALLWLRLAVAALGLLLRPRPDDDRSLAAFDLEPPAARFWHRRLAQLVGWFTLGWAAIDVLRAFAMPPAALLLFAYLLGLGLVAIVLAMVWRRAPDAPPILADGAAGDTAVDPASPAAGSAARSTASAAAGNAGRWLASLVTVLFWLVWAAGAMPVFWLLVAAIGLPIAIGAARRGSRHLLRPVDAPDGTAGMPSLIAIFVEQGLRAALIVGAILILLWGWGLDVGSLAAQETAATRLLRGALHALIILLVADLAWSLLKAVADNALIKAQVAAGIDADEARRRARIRTLLPIGRNVAAIVLLVMAGLMALAALGVEIGPLVASAGVVGVAVGFGAQTVVRDMISGMFYMIDDAFRVGEYIQSGSYKGTVELFSLRSVKLRHQRGPLFTIPFGELGAVQNMSRDWVIVKDEIGITYDSDIDMARRLIKQVGIELAAIPDFAPSILQPLKMQGVEEFGDYAIKVRTKMMTKPGEQFVIRRRANAMIKKAFDANGVKFAFPTVQLAGSGEGATDGAIVAAAQQVLKPPAATAA